MTSSSHLAGSALVYLAASAVAESQISIGGLAVTAVGSLLPDIDTPTSSIGRPFFPLASWINQKIGHRTLTHSLVGVFLFALLVMAGMWITGRWTEGCDLSLYGQLLILGYGSHVFIDSLNKTGVELFWPSKLRCVFLYGKHYRITAAGRGDYCFMTICLILSLGLYPLARDGFTRSLHSAFGDIYSVAMDYKQYGDKNRIWLNLQGVEAISNQKVRGRFEILAALDNASVLIDRGGVKQIVSRTKPLQIFPDRVNITVGEPVVIKTEEINMAGRTLGEIPRFPGAQRVHLYGYLTPARFTPVSVHENRYDPISLRLDKLKLEHAEYEDIQEQGLEHVLIREGILIAKIYRRYGPTEPVAALPVPARPLQHVEVRFQPNDEILISEGDLVRVGQVIARKDVSLQVERLQAQYRDKQQDLEQALSELELQLASARRDLREAEIKRHGTGRQATVLNSESLFAKEYVQLKTSLVSEENRISEVNEKIRVLERRQTEMEDQLTADSKRLARETGQARKQSEVLSGFAGRVRRIEQKPEGHTIIYAIIYEPS